MSQQLLMSGSSTVLNRPFSIGLGKTPSARENPIRAKWEWLSKSEVYSGISLSACREKRESYPLSHNEGVWHLVPHGW